MASKSKKYAKVPGAPPVTQPTAKVAAWRGWSFSAPGIIIFAASVLLLWNLDYKYLWQDEAATAVLASRMLKSGKPLAYDGLNLITTDLFDENDAKTVDQRTASANSAIDYYVRKGDFRRDLSWKWQPWGSFVLCALSLEVLGKTTLAARLPLCSGRNRRHFSALPVSRSRAYSRSLPPWWIASPSRKSADWSYDWSRLSVSRRSSWSPAQYSRRKRLRWSVGSARAFSKASVTACGDGFRTKSSGGIRRR